MENELITKRGLILFLVIATGILFIGLVWAIATYLPWNILGLSSPSRTPNIVRIEKNCTYPLSYWKEHPELYPPRMVLGSKIYQAADIREVLSGGSQDPAAQLQAQLVGAFLNILSGASQSQIDATIFQAYDWIVKNSDGNQISESERKSGSRLYAELEAYNLGLSGVLPCQGITVFTPTETATPSWTATPLLTGTPNLTITPTPSLTISPTSLTPTPTRTSTIAITSRPATPTRTNAPSPTKSSTPVVTRTYTQTPPSTPTNTFTPQPTNTPLPPTPTNTYTPQPTNTPLPPTPTNTFTPKPTSTPAPPTPTYTIPPPPTSTYTQPPPPKRG